MSDMFIFITGCLIFATWTFLITRRYIQIKLRIAYLQGKEDALRSD